MTGFSAATHDCIRQREYGRCARCGGTGSQAHHRRPRGMGGSSRDDTNQASNGLWLCQVCHDYLDGHRDIAEFFGWLVPAGADPAEVPVFYLANAFAEPVWVLLDDDGMISFTDRRPI